MNKSRQHLIQRNHIWYARLSIPKDVRAKLGRKREYIQSLKTGDINTAEVRTYSSVISISLRRSFRLGLFGSDGAAASFKSDTLMGGLLSKKSRMPIKFLGKQNFSLMYL